MVINNKYNSSFCIYLPIYLPIAQDLTACSDGLSQLERIKSRGTLRIALIATPPLYFPDESLIKGYDYEIIASYANLSVLSRNHHCKYHPEIITKLKQGKAHIGIAGNSPDYPDENIIGSTSYEQDEWYVIGNRKNICQNQSMTLRLVLLSSPKAVNLP